MSFYVFKKVMGNGFIRGAVPPIDKNLQWIDTSAEKPSLKYFKEDTQTWEELSPEDIPNQINKLGVTATTSIPKEIIIDIVPTVDFAMKPVQVLKLLPAQTNVSTTQMKYDNTDSKNFIYNANEVSFDGTMHQKTEYTYDLVSQGTIGTGQLHSYSLKKDYFKKIAKMEVL